MRGQRLLVIKTLYRSNSEATVKTHAGHIMTKLGLRDRIQAVVYAYETGLITPQGRAIRLTPG
jgi:Bacterial regulatory proteins, luxR family